MTLLKTSIYFKPENYLEQDVILKKTPKKTANHAADLQIESF